MITSVAPASSGFIVLGLLASCGSTPDVADASTTPAGWRLVWNDEFDSDVLDETLWEIQLGDGSELGIPGWGNHELQVYTVNNHELRDGCLVIEARVGESGDAAYTSTRLRTRGHGDWTHGRFEVRARMPVGQGLWPAIWMLPTDSVYGTWAASGEIDIVEYLGHEPRRILGTLHHGGAWPDNRHEGGDHVLATGSFAEEFHVFALEWDPNEIRWYVDDTLYHSTHTWESVGHAFPAPFDQRFYLLLNVAVGGGLPGSPDASTVFPQRMWVDWVRVYSRD